MSTAAASLTADRAKYAALRASCKRHTADSFNAVGLYCYGSGLLLAAATKEAHAKRMAKRHRK